MADELSVRDLKFGDCDSVAAGGLRFEKGSVRDRDDLVEPVGVGGGGDTERDGERWNVSCAERERQALAGSFQDAGRDLGFAIRKTITNSSPPYLAAMSLGPFSAARLGLVAGMTGSEQNPP